MTTSRSPSVPRRTIEHLPTGAMTLPAMAPELAASLERCVESLDDLIRYCDDPGTEALGAVYEAKALLRRSGVDVGRSTGAPSLLAHLDTLQDEVGEHVVRFRVDPGSDADRLGDALIIAEEMGETMQRLAQVQAGICRAALKRRHGRRPETDWDAELRKEAADGVIALLSLAGGEGWSLADAVTERWAEVRERRTDRVLVGENGEGR